MIDDALFVDEAVQLVTDCWIKIDILRKKESVQFFFFYLSFIEIYPLLLMGTSKLWPSAHFRLIK